MNITITASGNVKDISLNKFSTRNSSSCYKFKNLLPVNYLIFMVILFIIFSLPKTVMAAETQVLSWQEIKKLDKEGRVHLIKMLDDGRMIFFSQRGDYEDKILITTPTGRVSKRYKVPVKKFDYISCSDDGESIMLYTQENLEFFYLHGRGMKCTSFFRFEKGKKGFALYGKEKSGIFFADGNIFARGYYYDQNNQYLEDAIVSINPKKWGIAVFSVVVETNRLIEGARAFYKTARETGALDVCGNFLVCTPEDESGGVVMLFDMEKELLHKLDDFNDFTGMAVFPEKSLLVYSFAKVEDYKMGGELVLFDLKTMKPIKRWEGKYFNPRFDEKGEKIAAGVMVPLYGDRFVTKIHIIPVSGENPPDGKDDRKELVPSKKPIDWRFIDNGRGLYLYTGEEIYKWKIE